MNYPEKEECTLVITAQSNYRNRLLAFIKTLRQLDRIFAVDDYVDFNLPKDVSAGELLSLLSELIDRNNKDSVRRLNSAVWSSRLIAWYFHL